MSIRARAWTALAVPPIVWFLFEQGLSALLHTDCTRWPIGLAWGVGSLVACGLSLRLAWPLRGHHGALANPWLARLAIALTGVFCLAIAIVPACVG